MGDVTGIISERSENTAAYRKSIPRESRKLSPGGAGGFHQKKACLFYHFPAYQKSPVQSTTTF